VFGKGAGLAQKLINHGGFSMVNVGDDRNVSNLLTCHGSLSI
jgi:hypothetical protein